jgi:hypothetical protein
MPKIIFLILFLFLSSGCANNPSKKEVKDIETLQCKLDADCTLTTFLDQACCDAPNYLPISKQDKKIQDEWRYKNCDYNVPNNQACPIITYEKEGVPFCNQGTCDMR